MITHKQIKQWLHYAPETGKLTWLVSLARKIRIGDEAGSIGRNGYRYIQIKGRMYLAQRLIWNYQTGEWPPEGMEVDHINTDRSDYRWVNLRLLTPTLNKMNTSVRMHNMSGVKGVHFDNRYSRAKRPYRAQISIRGKTIYLGYFPSAEEASKAYQEAHKARFLSELNKICQ